MSIYVRWHLIIDVCKPRSLWSPSAWNPVAYWCFVEFSIVHLWRPVMKPSRLHGQPVFRVKKNRFHLHVTVTLCNIHHRPFFRPYSMSTRAGFSFVLFFSFFWLSLIAAKDVGTSKTLPLFKTWILSRPPIPLWNCWGKLCKEEEAAVELCMQETVLKCDTGHTVMHTSSLHTTATPKRLNPQWDWMVLGIWHNTK